MDHDMMEKKEEIEMGEKVRRRMDKFCDGMEIVLAVFAGAVLVGSTVLYILSLFRLAPISFETEFFSLFLNDIFALVVGIEFIQMLLKPSVDNVIEVLVFLVTRHLILSHGSALDMLGCVICILLLYAFHFLLHYLKIKHPHLSHSIEKDASHLGIVEEKDETK